MNIREYLNSNPAIIDFFLIEWLDDDILSIQVKTYEDAIEIVKYLETLDYQLEKWQEIDDFVEVLFERLYEGKNNIKKCTLKTLKE